MGTASGSPLFEPKDHDQPSVFQVDDLIREARRQRGLRAVPVPDVCLLDPDGDTIRHLETPVQHHVTRTGPATTPSSG